MGNESYDRLSMLFRIECEKLFILILWTLCASGFNIGSCRGFVPLCSFMEFVYSGNEIRYECLRCERPHFLLISPLIYFAAIATDSLFKVYSLASVSSIAMDHSKRGVTLSNQKSIDEDPPEVRKLIIQGFVTQKTFFASDKSACAMQLRPIRCNNGYSHLGNSDLRN